jgi:hypothetical protein
MLGIAIPAGVVLWIVIAASAAAAMTIAIALPIRHMRLATPA